MAISPPNFQKDAIPTPQGWRHPRTNELLVSRKISADEINEYFGAAPTPPVQVLTEAPTNLEEATNELIDSLPSDVEPPVDDDDENAVLRVGGKTVHSRCACKDKLRCCLELL